MQLYVYRDRGATGALLDRARAAGCEAIVLTADAAVLGTREGDVRSGFHLPSHLDLPNVADQARSLPAADGDSGLASYVARQLDPSLSWSDLEWLADRAGLPLILKGIVRADDARRAVDAGVAGLVVSNHGGRQLDGGIATARALPEVVDAVGGAAEVYVDGGIRRGTDVLKALALGADAVLVGRPVLWGLAVDGADGVRSVLDQLAGELLEAMKLAGSPTIDAIGRDLVVPA
jgi:4-hydroxymandelate oxidase